MPGDFKASDHLETIKGKSYLNAQWRLVWFRDAEPDGQITTQILEHVAGEYALVKAIVSRSGGGVGTGHKLVTAKQFGDYLAKAETQAIARALAAAGFGTQFAVELADEDVDEPDPSRLADSGVSRQQAAQPAPRAVNAPQSAPQAPQRPANVTTLPPPAAEVKDKDSFFAWIRTQNLKGPDVLRTLDVASTTDWFGLNPGKDWSDLKKAVSDAIFPAPPAAEASS